MAKRESPFISIRWRLTVPLFAVVLVITMLGIYLLVSSTDAIYNNPAPNILQQGFRSISLQTTGLQQSQHRTAQTVAFFSGIQSAARSGDADTVQDAIATRAANAGTDSLVLVDLQGRVVIGFLRGQAGSLARISVYDSGELLVTRPDEMVTGLAESGGDVFLTTAVPVTLNTMPVGYVLAGHRVSTVLEALKPSVIMDAILYSSDNRALGSTFATEEVALDSLTRAVRLPDESLSQLVIEGENYYALELPFEYGGASLGTISLVTPEQVGPISSIGRQLGSLLLALLGASVVIVVFIASHWVAWRGERVRQTAEALTMGEFTARTHMQPTDEIGAIGQSLDQYADYVQDRQDMLRNSLRRQRRENERLTAILESLPDGVIVQDLGGQLLMINEKARTLIGSTQLLRSNADLQEMMALVTDKLGPALAPGIYTLGEAQQIQIEERVLSAQAAAVMTAAQQRIGTVIVLRDITEDVEREAARQRVLEELEDDLQEPLSHLVHVTKRSPAQDFSSELQRHSGSLQRMILELQDLTNAKLQKQPDQHRPLLLDTLVWAIANDWRQVAQAQNLELHVIIEQSGLYVLGEERRLRWAIGNIIDNAIKYTPPGGDLTLEIQEDISDGQAHLRVRDNGVGIARDELPYVMNRFYRGRPMTEAGREIRVPGSGQGLTTAKQIFETHGGTIDVRSKQGIGTAVFFTIPLTAAQSYEIPQFSLQSDEETIPLQRSDPKPDS